MISKRILFSAFVAAVLLLALPAQTVSAASIIRTVGPGIITLDYRDITSFDPTPEPVISVVGGINRGDIGTITITDFNGNLDPDNQDSITVTANSEITPLGETDPGVFVGSFITAENNNIVYVPDPPESARATVTIDLASSTDVTLSDVQILDGDLQNIEFRPVTHALDVDLADSGALTLGTTITVTISFANAIFITGVSVVAAGNSDVGSPLIAFAADEMHEDSGATATVFDAGEIIYKDADDDGTVSIDDTRLANAANQGFTDDSVVADGDSDVGFTLVAFKSDEMHADSGGTPTVFDAGEIIYKDADDDGTVSVGDTRLANAPSDSGFECLLKMFYKAPGENWEQVDGEIVDCGETLFSVTSGATTVLGSPITEGQFVLGYPTGLGGGGGGGLVRPGLVLNALFGVIIGGGGLDKTPPSLTRTISSGVQFDPFEPIAPTGSLADTTAQPPLRINQNGYNLYGYSNTIVTNTIETGQFTDMSLAFNEASKVEHVAVYFVDQDRDEYSDTDPALIFDNGNIAKVDPQGIFGDDIQMSTSKEGTKSIFNFGMSFDKPTNKHIIIVAWDDKRNSGTTKIFNALQVVGNEIPDQVAHFMPIEALGEFDLIKDDNGQYVLLEPIKTETVTDLPQTTVYPEFVGRMDRHEMKVLYDSIDYEKDRASSIMVQKFKLDTKLFADDTPEKSSNDLGRAAELTWSHVGHKFRDIANTFENKEIVKKLMWEEHLKAEKTLKAYLEQRNHRE